MGRFLVMDIVFYGGSLNYDQGTGNYQELKKITKWDGRQYTLVSRYALRYSLLETAKNMGLWEIAKGDKLQLAGEADKKVIQPAMEILLSGEVLKYPEFDLFGYLITQPREIKQPQNFRTAPVKISHAISMAPFNYDTLFNANIGLANRMRKRFGKMEPNPFTAEEHITYYQYSVVVDVDNVGEIEVYFKEDSKVKLGDNTEWTVKEVVERDKITVKLNTKSNKSKEIVQIDGVEKLGFNKLDKNKLILIKYSLKKESNNDPVKERICELINAILNLKRSIKGRDEDLSPKLMVVGIYKNRPYRTYKDEIALVDEYVEEEYDEIEEKTLENGGRSIKVRHKMSKSKKPIFEIGGIDRDKSQQIEEEKVLSFINKLFSDSDDRVKETNKENKFNKNDDEKERGIEEVKVFYDPSIRINLTKGDANSKEGKSGNS